MINYKQLRQTYAAQSAKQFGWRPQIPQKRLKTPCLTIILLVMTIFFILLVNGCVYASDLIDMAIIAKIESSNNPNAYNKGSGAVGLCQVTKPVLVEYNAKWRTNWKMADLYNANLNILVATWYMEERIPQMLKYYKIKDTVRNRLIAYNCGIKCLVVKRKLPTETINYIIKYEELEGRQ